MNDRGVFMRYTDMSRSDQFTQKKIETLANYIYTNEDLGKYWSFEKIRDVLAAHIERCESYLVHNDPNAVQGWRYYLKTGEKVPYNYSRTHGALYQYLTYDLGIFPIPSLIKKRKRESDLQKLLDDERTEVQKCRLIIDELQKELARAKQQFNDDLLFVSSLVIWQEEQMRFRFNQ